MIVTVTPNPSLDRTLEVPGLERGAVVRAQSVRTDPGGKGINVSLALVTTGHPSRAVMPLGGHEGEQLGAAARSAGIDVVSVPITEPVRVNISLVEPDRTVTKINAPGPRLSTSQAKALTMAAVAAVDGAAWIVGCGSLPPGVADPFYAELVAEARGAGVRVAIDSSGPPLAAAVTAGPDLVKPNVHELAEVSGRRVRTLGDVLAAASALRERGVGTVVASLGPDGAVLASADGAWHATTPPIAVRSAVGAGDALVAGLLAAGGDGPDALRTGVAYAVGAARLPGTQFPRPEDLDLGAVAVCEIDADRPLTEPGGTR